MRRLSLILVLAFGAMAVCPAYAQVIPDPSAGRQLYIRNNVGKIIERLQPNGSRYDVYDMKRQSLPIGYAKMLGRRMTIYDLNDNVVATMRAELLPPGSDLSIITIVRDRDGHPIGFLERY